MSTQSYTARDHATIIARTLEEQGLIDTSLVQDTINTIGLHIAEHFFQPSQVTADPNPAPGPKYQCKQIGSADPNQLAADMAAALNDGWSVVAVTECSTNEGAYGYTMFLSRVKPA